MTAAILAVAAVTGVVICGLAGWAGLATRRRMRAQLAQRESAVRSALYRSLTEPSQPARILDDLVAGDRRLLEAKARALLPSLQGEDRETLARLLESRGVTESARRRSHSRRPRARADACRLLGDLGSSFAVLDLVPRLDDPRPAVRLAAARALGRLDQPTAVAPLIGSVTHEHPLPVDVAADAIHQIHDWPMGLLEHHLSDPSEPSRALAVELLGRFQVVGSLNALIDLLESDPAPDVRIRAARALGRIGSPHALQPLIACLSSGPAELRIEAAVALGRLGSATAVPALRLALLGPSPRLSACAAGALSAITPDGVDVLAGIAEDDHPAAAVARRALAARQAAQLGRLPA